MSTTSEEIRLVVKTEMDKALKDLKKFNDGLGKTQKESKSLTKDMKALKRSFIAVGAGVATVVIALKKAVDAASDLEEVTGKFNVVFGDTPELLAGANESVDELTNSYIISEREAREYLGTVQDLLVPMGIMPQKAAGMSAGITKLAADLASFNNVPTETAMQKILSGLVGMGRPMLEWGVQINEATLKAEAYAMGLSNGKDVLDAATKAQAAFAIMTRQSAAAQGDVIRTSDSWANRMKQLEATSEDFAAALGAQLIPSLKNILDSFEMTRDGAIDLATGIGILMKKLGELGGHFATLNSIATPFGALVKLQISQMKFLADKVKEAGAEERGFFKEIQKGMPQQKGFFEGLAAGVPKIQKVTDATKKMSKAASGAGKSFLEGRRKAQEAIDMFLAKGEESAQAEILKETQKFEKLKADGIKFRADIEGIERQHQENIQLIKEEFDEKENERRLEGVNNFVAMTQTVTGQVAGIFDQFFKNKNIALNNEQKKRRKEIIANVKDEEERKKQLAALDAEFDKKRANLARKQAKANKAIALIGAIQATALGVTKALAGTFSPAANIALAAVIGSLGAAQVALIARQPIPEAAEGAIIPGSGQGQLIRAGENGRSEAIIPLESESGQDALGGSGVTVNINIQNAFADEDFPEKIAVEIDKALSKLVQDRNSRLQDSL